MTSKIYSEVDNINQTSGVFTHLTADGKDIQTSEFVKGCVTIPIICGAVSSLGKKYKFTSGYEYITLKNFSDFMENGYVIPQSSGRIFPMIRSALHYAEKVKLILIKPSLTDKFYSDDAINFIYGSDEQNSPYGCVSGYFYHPKKHNIIGKISFELKDKNYTDDTGWFGALQGCIASVTLIAERNKFGKTSFYTELELKGSNTVLYNNVIYSNDPVIMLDASDKPVKKIKMVAYGNNYLAHIKSISIPKSIINKDAGTDDKITFNEIIAKFIVYDKNSFMPNVAVKGDAFNTTLTSGISKNNEILNSDLIYNENKTFADTGLGLLYFPYHNIDLPIITRGCIPASTVEMVFTIQFKEAWKTDFSTTASLNMEYNTYYSDDGYVSEAYKIHDNLLSLSYPNMPYYNNYVNNPITVDISSDCNTLRDIFKKLNLPIMKDDDAYTGPLNVSIWNYIIHCLPNNIITNIKKNAVIKINMTIVTHPMMYTMQPVLDTIKYIAKKYDTLNDVDVIILEPYKYDVSYDDRTNASKLTKAWTCIEDIYRDLFIVNLNTHTAYASYHLPFLLMDEDVNATIVNKTRNNINTNSFTQMSSRQNPYIIDAKFGCPDITELITAETAGIIANGSLIATSPKLSNSLPIEYEYASNYAEIFYLKGCLTLSVQTNDGVNTTCIQSYINSYVPSENADMKLPATFKHIELMYIIKNVSRAITYAMETEFIDKNSYGIEPLIRLRIFDILKNICKNTVIIPPDESGKIIVDIKSNENNTTAYIEIPLGMYGFVEKIYINLSI